MSLLKIKGPLPWSGGREGFLFACIQPSDMEWNDLSTIVFMDHDDAHKHKG